MSIACVQDNNYVDILFSQYTIFPPPPKSAARQQESTKNNSNNKYKKYCMSYKQFSQKHSNTSVSPQHS